MDKFELPAKVVGLMEKFEKAGGEIYVVGGAVRDLIIGRKIYDWDFATSITPEEMQKLFPKNGFYNNEFGTFRVVIDKELFEITTYRSEEGYGDFRHPTTVKWGKTIEEDLGRRDFTINAMALRLASPAQGYNLVDVYGGQEDIKNKIIRAVRDADERFKEDALRQVKAFRMAAQLGFMIEEKTLEAIIKNNDLIRNISGERIRDEMFKLLSGDHPGEALRLMKNAGVLKIVLPEILESYGVKQKGHHIYDVWEHNIRAMENCVSRDPVTRLATLLHDAGKPRSMRGEGESRTFHNHEVIGSRMAVEVGKRWRLSNKQLDQLFRLVRWHMFTTEVIQTDSAVRRLIRNVTPEYLQEMVYLRQADRVGSGAKITSWRWEALQKRFEEVQKQPFSIKDLKVDGNDVMEILKIKPSRRVGEVLAELFKEVEQKPELNVREWQLEKIKSFL